MPVLSPPLIATLMLAGADAAADAPPREPRPVMNEEGAPPSIARVTIEQHVIIRIPAQLPRLDRTARPPAPPEPPELEAATREVKGPKCLPIGRIRGAIINHDQGVTMITATSERFITRFEQRCHTDDFYAGFYVEPNKDGALCAGRDTLHARNGSNCKITQFGRLVPDR